MSMFGRDLLGNVRMRIVHFDFIYAQKDSFAHRYGILEICGAFAVRFRLVRPGRPLSARSLPPARGGRLLRRLLALARWPAGLRGDSAAFVRFREDDCFFYPHLA